MKRLFDVTATTLGLLLINESNREVSLVGPQPLLIEYLPLYTLDQARRH